MIDLNEDEKKRYSTEKVEKIYSDLENLFLRNSFQVLLP